MTCRRLREAALILMSISMCCGCGNIEAPSLPEDLLDNKTNVLLIVVDTLRADHLSCYGYPHPTSPNIDKIAENGIRFTQFYANSPWTRPSMASMLTGLYPRTTGVHEERYDSLPPDLTTLSERLQAQGYYTLQVTSNPNLNEVFGFRQGFNGWLDSKIVWKFIQKHGDQKRFGKKTIQLDNAKHTTNRTLDLLRTHQGALDEQPFYLQVVYIDPHFPYKPPKSHLELFEIPGVPNPGYDGDIHFADHHIGRLLDKMTEMGLMDDTLIIITSDHGEGLTSQPNLPKSTHHGWYLYDSALHVPLIIHHPALPSPSRSVDTLASGIDLVPTLIELLGLPDDTEPLPGRSLAGDILGTKQVPDVPFVFSESDWRTIQKVRIHSKTKKLIHNQSGEMYQTSGAHEGKEISAQERKLLNNIPIYEYYPSQNIPESWDSSLPPDPSFQSLKLALSQWQQTYAVRGPIGRDEEDVTTAKDGSQTPSPYTKTTNSDAVSDDLTLQLQALGYLGNKDTGKPKDP